VAGRSIVILRRFRGPLRSANGGYAAGRLAAFVPAPGVEVSLLAPPPLETPLRVEDQAEGAVLFDGDQPVAEARAADPGIDPPVPPSWEAAAATSGGAGSEVSPEFAECFVCGRRAEDDGLGIHAGPLPGRDMVATTWIAGDVAPEIVWAAIDGPGAYAVGGPGRGTIMLARMTAVVHRLPRDGERCIVAGWPLGEERRKLHAGTALYGDGGEVLAVARQLWILPVAER
jgi:hypothetical protein